jgi:GTP-binding protein HflX
VGFLRDLPKDLMDAFRATLEELKDADLLLHIIDIAHPRCEEQMAAVEKILEDLDLQRTPLLRVFNKADKVDPETAGQLCRAFGAISLSALNPETFPPLLRAMEEKLFSPQAGLKDQRREGVALSLSANTRLAICAKN